MANTVILKLKKLTIFFSKRSSLELFLILILVIFLTQFTLLHIILKYGFTGDEWLLLFDYKTIGYNGGFLNKIFAVFHAKGIYTSYQVIYIGILESLFKGNYFAYQLTNIILKGLATLSIFPLVLIVFRRKLLAILTTLLYGMSYSSSGALQFVVKGSDYIAIFFMNLCLITYYFSLKSKRKLFLLITGSLIFLSFVFSPIRIYPFLLFISLTEIFINIKSKGIVGLVVALRRLAFLFLPFILILMLLPKATGGYLNGPLVVYKLLTYGNYQLLLTPFAGLGYIFLPNDYWKIFGTVTFDSFKDYLIFLLRGPVIIYTCLVILLNLLVFKKKLVFILGILFLNFSLEIASYFLVTNLKGVTGSNVKSFYPISTYAIFFGFFVASISISSLLMILRKSKSESKNLLLAVFIGPIFASVFLWGTWLIIGDSLTFKEGIHWYLILPPIGSSLFLAGLMVLAFDKIKTLTGNNLQYMGVGLLLLILLGSYLISSKEINTTFGYYLHIGYGGAEQDEMKNKLTNQINEPLDTHPALFYLDTTENSDKDPLFYPVTLISAFGERMHFKDWEIVNGCVGLIYDKVTLEKSVTVKGGIKGFTAPSLCVYNYFSVGRPEMFYKPENFYALKLKGKEVINIKDDILKELKVDKP